jgi:hypothetical protein
VARAIDPGQSVKPGDKKASRCGGAGVSSAWSRQILIHARIAHQVLKSNWKTSQAAGVPTKPFSNRYEAVRK